MTTFTVKPLGERPETALAAADIPAPPKSALAGLRARRDARRAAHHLDLLVPGYDNPSLCVRCRALRPDEIDTIQARFPPDSEERSTRAGAALLARATTAIFYVDTSNREIGAPGEWWSFTGANAEPLAAEMGIALTIEGGGSDLVRAVFDDDGAIFRASEQLMSWSAYIDVNLVREAPKA